MLETQERNGKMGEEQKRSKRERGGTKIRRLLSFASENPFFSQFFPLFLTLLSNECSTLLGSLPAFPLFKMY